MCVSSSEGLNVDGKLFKDWGIKDQFLSLAALFF